MIATLARCACVQPCEKSGSHRPTLIELWHSPVSRRRGGHLAACCHAMDIWVLWMPAEAPVGSQLRRPDVHTVHWRAWAQLRHLHAQCTPSRASAGTHWQQLRPFLAVSGSQAADWALLRGNMDVKGSPRLTERGSHTTAWRPVIYHAPVDTVSSRISPQIGAPILPGILRHV